jgi:predicted lipoprotein with Yx(FWY)xxD motif
MIRSRSTFTVAGATALVLTVLAAAGCGGSGGSSSAGSPPTLPKTANGSPATIGVSNGTLGTILVDSQGRTLYLFQHDVSSTSTCTGACATNWPPLRATGKPTVGSGAKASLVATSPRQDGGPQVTYNGHPLYRFAGDQNPGDAKGQGINAYGGLWYAVSPAGNLVSGGGSGSSGYGY